MNKDKLMIPAIGMIGFYLILHAFGINTICYFKGLTGIPCPGCGFTRSFLHLFQGDVRGAFFYHPLFIIPIFCAFLLFLQYIKKIKISRNVWLGIVIIMFIVYGIRMYLLFPHTPPLDFEQNAIFPMLYQFLYSKIHG